MYIGIHISNLLIGPLSLSQDKEKAEAKFMDIAEAYEVLSTEEMRAKYDRGEDVFENQGNGGGQQRRHHGFPGGGHGNGGFHFKFG